MLEERGGNLKTNFLKVIVAVTLENPRPHEEGSVRLDGLKMLALKVCRQGVVAVKVVVKICLK